MTKRDKEKLHQCQLGANSYSCLPLVSPRKNRLYKFWRQVRKQLLISKRHYKVQAAFVSLSSVTEQRRHHLKTNKYAIHPYSNFMIYYEIAMALMWLVSLFKDPLLYSFVPFYDYVTTQTMLLQYMLVNAYFDFTLMLLSLFNFFIGYFDEKKNAVELRAKKITKRYLLTFFVIDYCTLPIHLCVYLKRKQFYPWYLFRLLTFLRITRLWTVVNYMRQITIVTGMNAFAHSALGFCLWMLLMVHWINCLYCLYVKFVQELYPELAKDFVLKIDKFDDHNLQYFASMYVTANHLYNISLSKMEAVVEWEQVFLLVVLAFGKCFVGVIVCHIFVVVRMTISSRAKYEGLLSELRSYAKVKRLPIEIEERLIKYYRMKFQQKYFKETAIMRQLTPSLLRQIKILTSNLVVDKAIMFKGLSHQAIEDVVCRLTEDFYLENDVIARARTVADGLYILAYGTCAIINEYNIEMLHLNDGDHFGEFALMTDGFYVNNIVAVTHCHIYKLSSNDFFECMRKYSAFKVTMQIHVEYLKKSYEKRESHVDNQITIINQLREKMILEKARKRN